MLRSLLLGILAVSAVASCGSKEDAPAATPGAPAGKVLELSGTVTATRGTEVRTLVPGGEISADDVIGTAAESRVVILVAHNNARWDLGPNRTGKVGESLAWTAAKQAGPAAVVKEETSTAGRHAEKTAATTTTTTAAAADRKAMEQGADGPGAAPVGAAAPMAPEPTEEAKTTPPPPKTAGSKPRPPSSGPGTSPPPPPPPPPSDKEDDARATTTRPMENARKVEGNGASNDGPDMQPKGPYGSSKPSGDESAGDGTRRVSPTTGTRPTSPLELEIRSTLGTQSTALQVCLGTDLTRLVLKVEVNDGTYTITTADPKATAAARRCLAKVAKTLKATAKGKASVSHAIAK